MIGQRFFLYSEKGIVYKTDEVLEIQGKEQKPKVGKLIKFKTKRGTYTFKREE